MSSCNDTVINKGVVVGLDDKNKQVITVHADGSVSGLVHKPGKGVAIMDMGKASVVRASTIDWNDIAQHWVIRFLAGPRSGDLFNWGDMIELSPSLSKSDAFKEVGEDPKQVVGFKTYELAVKMEIDFFNAERIKGNMSYTDKTI